MRAAYVTVYDASDIRSWSGLGYYIAKALEDQKILLERIGPLHESQELLFKVKRKLYGRVFRKKYLRVAHSAKATSYASQVKKALASSQVDLVFSPGIVPICYLDTSKPIVYWTDATFAGLVDFYPVFTNLAGENLRDGHRMHQEALRRSSLAIYSSDWAAQTAIENYQVDPSKVRVVPFGANIECDRNFEDIKAIIDLRPSDRCKLLFLGVDWFRKGGDTALKVAKALNESGLPTDLTVVGCQPVVEGSLPQFVQPLGFISKSTVEGRKKILELMSESHFLILPSIADCTPVVFCEVNSFGLPCLSTDVGGIPTIIRSGINGQVFSRNAEISEYCEYIERLFSNYSSYQDLALSSFNEYQNRLNWSTSGRVVRRLMEDLL